MTQNTFKSLVSLYELMDHTWDKVAALHHFTCNGCEDNCCRSLFFHHTHIEKAYLLHGFQELTVHKRKKILDRAKTYCQETFSHSSEIKSKKIYCPANEAGLCLLYRYRPMICRLHGLPHELNRPGSGPVRGEGCDAGRFDDKTYVKFDRTPFYQQMGQIEMVFRRDKNIFSKIKETVAQMLVSQ